ncbi:hypothetical protein D3C78_1292930 [compost metagenome]
MSERLFQLVRIQGPVIGVPVGRRMKAQHMAFLLLTAHHRAANITAPGTRRTGLQEKHRLDAGLYRVVCECVQHLQARVPDRRGAGPIIECQQEADRGLFVQALLGLRRQFDGGANAARQTNSKGCDEQHPGDVFHVLPFVDAALPRL